LGVEWEELKSFYLAYNENGFLAVARNKEAPIQKYFRWRK
jgi:hypothetical protein